MQYEQIDEKKGWDQFQIVKQVASSYKNLMEVVVRDVVHFCDMMSDKYSGVKFFSEFIRVGFENWNLI